VQANNFTYQVKKARIKVAKPNREEKLSLHVTRGELYMISRKARAIGMSRPDLVVDAVTQYEKDGNHKQRIEQVNQVQY
jgi:uncharacterized protein (DUF1778 family)